MAMIGMTQNLILEIQSDETLATNPVIKMYLEGAKNVVATNSDSEEIFESLVNNLDALADFVGEKKDAVKGIVKNAKDKLAKTPKNKAKSFLGSIGLKDKVKKIKGSKAHKDPVVKGGCDKVDEALTVMPEFKALVPFIRIFEGFTYDPDVKEVVNEAKTFLADNRSKLMITDTIFELSKSNQLNSVYKGVIEILEECLNKDETTSSAVSMRLRDFKTVSIVNRLVNALRMHEGQENGIFDMGIGSGNTTVTDVISPFFKNEKKSYFFVEDKMYVITESDELEDEELDPDLISQEEYEGLPEAFRNVCEAFYHLGFKEIDGRFVSTSTRHLKVAFKTNESGKVELYVNNSLVEDLASINVSELGMMEAVQSRRLITDLFEGLSYISNIENTKRIRNSSFANEAYAIGFENKVYVKEKENLNPNFVKISPIGFHNYVLERFQYDIRSLYSIKLSEAEELAYEIEDEKRLLNADIDKLEQTEQKIEEALQNPDLDEAASEKLNDLLESIKKSIVSYRNKYVSLDLAKKN